MKEICAVCKCELDTEIGIIIVIVPVLIKKEWVLKYLCRTCFFEVDALPYSQWNKKMGVSE